MGQVADRVSAYMAGVLDGSIVSCRLVRLAVERQAADMLHAPARGFVFDAEEAERCANFFPRVCVHTSKEWAGQPFELADWELFVIWCVFGWRRSSDHTRRFRKAFISVARKNGKTAFAAAISLLLLVFDHPLEMAAQLYCAATKLDQAKLLFEEAKRMAMLSPVLRNKLDFRAERVVFPRTFGYMLPIGGRSKMADGFAPHAVFKDELHEWAESHRGLHEKLSTGGAANRQPIEVITTTAGDETSLIWQEELAYAIKCIDSVVTGEIVSDSVFAFVAQLDPDDDPFDEAIWPKANPNLGVSVKLEYLRERATEAQHKPTARSSFLRYHCNRQVSSCIRAITPELWGNGCGQLSDWREADGVFAGIDLGWRDDFSAIGLVARFTDEHGQVRYEISCQTFAPHGGKREVWREPFASWQRGEWLTITDGNTTDIEAIREAVLSAHEQYGLLSVALDPANARQFGQELLNNHGLHVVEFFQACRSYNEPVRAFFQALHDGAIRHDGNPCLQWQMLNMAIYENPAQQQMPSKKQSGEKIDGAVAVLMAFAMALTPTAPRSFYESNAVEMG